MVSFKSARLKVERANKHIAEIRERVRTLPDAYSAGIEANPQTGQKFIKHVLHDTTIAIDLALVIGDAVHNLKCALDHAWFAAIQKHAPSAVSDFAKFPVYPTRNKLESVLTGREINISSPALFDLIVTKIRSYEGGNDAVWAIHRLDILDKHRLLVPLITYASVNNIEMENEKGELVKGGTLGLTSSPPWYIHIPDGWHVKNNGKPAATVLFDKGTPVHFMDVFDLLAYYTHLVLQIIELLEGV